MYRRLSDDPSLINGDPDVQSFYNEKFGESLGKLVEVDKSSKYLHEIDPSIKGQIESLKNLTEGYRIQLTALNEGLSDNPTDSEWADLKQAQKLLYNQIEVAENQLNALYATVRSGKEIEADNIKGVNEGIYTNVEYELNDKTVNKIYLSTVARGNFVFTATQASQLWLIATQCPLSGGKSVFKTRGLYRLIDRNADFGNDFDICNANGILLNQTNGNENTEAKPENALEDLSSSQAVNTQTNDNILRVNPNPAQDELKITWTSLAGIGELAIYNSLGTVVLQKTVDNNFTVDISNLPVGIYWITVQNGTGNYATEKVLITR